MGLISSFRNWTKRGLIPKKYKNTESRSLFQGSQNPVMVPKPEIGSEVEVIEEPKPIHRKGSYSQWCIENNEPLRHSSNRIPKT